jgi:hypothetical protein
MNALPSLLLITALSISTSQLVLRDGARIDVNGAVKLENGRVMFRVGGTLYSVPADEVDLVATRAISAPALSVVSVAKPEEPLRLRVSQAERDRLLRDLEQNHVGKPASAEAFRVPPGPTPGQRDQATDDEWSWRRQARSYEEGIQRAQEQLDLLRDRADQLKAHIASLLSLGYKPNQFSYETTQLAYTLEAIPSAQLEVQRAQRANDQFRDEARRRGVMPGWLR